MIRVVADTNVFISALMFGGLPGKFLELALTGAFSLVTSPVLLDELDEKLRRKFQVSPKDAEIIRDRLESVAEVMIPVISLQIIRDDPDDDRVLECAIEGKSHYIVSGDRHLLELASFENIQIVKVRQFLDR